MAIIYRFVLKEKVNDLLKYGIRLSTQFDKEVNIKGDIKPCITGLLNPKDNEYKFNSDEYVGVKIDIAPNYCKVIDLAQKSDSPIIIELEDYKFGTFKLPEVLITSSILPERISILNKDIDTPVLYNNSTELYYSCRVSEMLDEMSPEETYLVLKKYFEKI